MKPSFSLGHRRHASTVWGRWRAFPLLAVLVARASAETLWHQRAADPLSSLAGTLGGHGEAEAAGQHQQQRGVMRREPSDSGEGEVQLLDIAGQSGSAQHRVVRSITSAQYSLWRNVSGMAGQVCADTGNGKYEKHTGDAEASSLERCMDHCETKFWCSTLSFHGNPQMQTSANVCIIVADPCAPVDPAIAAIPDATDNNWITMSYSYWPEVTGMAGHHCVNKGGVHFEQTQDVPSLEACMTFCENLAWCTSVSYETATNNCNLASVCVPAADEAGSLGFDNFQKGKGSGATTTVAATTAAAGGAPPALTVAPR